jgi:hypothetical protein
VSEKEMVHELHHRRSSIHIDEYVDRYTAMAISWNGDERLHITFGRDSLEVLSEPVILDPDNPGKATLGSGRSTAYRNDVASLTMPVEVAERLAVTILRMVENAKNRERSEQEK